MSARLVYYTSRLINLASFHHAEVSGLLNCIPYLQLAFVFLLPICSFCEAIGPLDIYHADNLCLPTKGGKESQDWPWNAHSLESGSRVEHIDDVNRLIASASHCWMCSFFFQLLDLDGSEPDDSLDGQRVYVETLKINHFSQALEAPVHKILRIPFIVKAGSPMANSRFGVSLLGQNVTEQSSRTGNE